MEPRYIRILTFALIAAATQVASASSFLEMPDTTEVPEFERDSLLLDMDVPEVRERDPDPRSGPRLNVREFRVQGIVEYPELGVHRQEIIEQIEAIRFDMMDEEAHLESGYTLEELASISDLIVEIEKETEDRHVGPMEVQRLVFHIREQRRKRGITLGMIESVADTITQYYRERGFILAKAYIPKQRVRDGIVNLTVLLGNLGEVQVENNSRYKDRTIQRIFDGIVDKPVKANVIEERLFFVNDLPGMRAQGYFEPGSQVGDSRITIDVTDERWYNANLRVDNHGSESSGEYRLYGDFYWHNPTGMGDQLQLGVLNSYEPDNSLYGSLRYSIPAYFSRLRFSMGASTNDFVLGETGSESFDALGITGQSKVIDAGFEYDLNRTRIKNSSLLLTWTRIESKLSSQAQDDLGLDNEVENIGLEYRFDVLDEKRRILHQGGLGVTSSRYLKTPLDNQEHEQEQNPLIVPMDYTLLAFWRLPFTDVQTRVVLRTSAQYSGVSMASINQFSLAGPNKARGYALNAFFADDGVHTGLDWILPGFGPFKEYIQPMVFADYGYGEAYSIIEGEDDLEVELSNAGVGLRMNYGRKLRGSLSIAEPITSKTTSEDDSGQMDEGVRVYFDMQYSF